MIKFSIIIPHKNIPTLLLRCLNSIPQRKDLEIIIVDDNSDSSIVDFSNFPGHDIPNVKIFFTKAGKGAGYARNIGLEFAKGEWVIFADSDDYFDTENLNKLFDSDYNLNDSVVWNYIKIEKQREFIEYQNNLVTSESDALFNMNQPWRMMRKLSVIKENNIKFQETIISNDLMFSRKFAYYCKSFAFYDKVVYYWERRDNSISASYTGQKLRVALNVSIDVNCYLKKIGKRDYFDCTEHYLSLLWKESKIEYWSYLFVICIRLGYDIADRFNKEVCIRVYIKNNVFSQIYDQIRVNLGGLRNRIF